MRKARPFKPAPKNASANRIRERYLHSLGVQRGADVPLVGDPSNHIVVISGLPSLPEDRATTNEHILESHDFSISRHSHHTGATPSSGGGAASDADENDDMMESTTYHKQSRYRSCNGDAQSHCSSVLSAGSSSTREADSSLTSMALAYPTALLKVPPPAKPTPPPSSNNTLPFSLSPWRTSSSSLSKSASAVLLDSADDHSVSSVGTSTTAESSLIARDWGPIPHPTSATLSVSSQGGVGGESPASTTTPGVYFQCRSSRPQHHCPTTSSLAHALNRFNIDSDCEASVASTSIAEDHIMDDDDTASIHSHTSAGSSKSQLSSASHNMRVGGRKKKKVGRTQRLMDRAAAHERILQIRSNQSQKMRANVVHSQRMGNRQQQVTVSGLSSVMSQDAQLEDCVRSTSSVCSQGSIPLVHVQHGGPQATKSPLPLPAQSMSDLGRTPTASNCSELRTLRALGPPSHYFPSLPMGVHVSNRTITPGEMMLNDWQQQQHVSDDRSITSTTSAPLEYHPQLASGIPTPPPKLVGMMLNQVESSAMPASVPSNTQGKREIKTESLDHVNHEQASVDDIMEVAMSLSKLRDVRIAPTIPRIR